MTKNAFLTIAPYFLHSYIVKFLVRVEIMSCLEDQMQTCCGRWWLKTDLCLSVWRSQRSEVCQRSALNSCASDVLLFWSWCPDLTQHACTVFHQSYFKRVNFFTKQKCLNSNSSDFQDALNKSLGTFPQSTLHTPSPVPPSSELVVLERLKKKKEKAVNLIHPAN